MQIELARTIARAAFRSSRELGALVPVLKRQLSAEEFGIYSKAIATAIASIQVDIVNKLTTEHSGLEAEIEVAIKRDGHY
ncbi:MAG: hypothetical protein AB7T86_04815 [Xanthobacteraceae bacterium]|jgi:hypothetical protein|uniref:hypothetical protein n=1 Tax=Pseudolabrys sp. TaxID=1960880 RepID=UPI003D0F670B